MNSVETFVSTLAKANGLEEDKYTNHCLRVTGINVLSPYFTKRQIRSVSGHKSDEGLQIYQRVDHQTKLRMGMSLGHALLHVPEIVVPKPAQLAIEGKPANEQQKAIKAPETPAITYEPENPISNKDGLIIAIPDPDQIEKNNDSPTPALEISDTDIVKILQQSEEETETIALTQQVAQQGHNTYAMKQVVQKKNSPRVPLFHNCTLSGSITININKN